ncbi:hypothetical protein [Marinicellulosiphila megalodicopiae]|uniref:hypothetical protein n=1 Tax=Marinicellulosiphila megalodicopiae TaxID=2724896 RepID=UPI003BB1CAE8
MVITFAYTATHSLVDAVDYEDSVLFNSKIVSLQPKKNIHRSRNYGLSRNIRVDREFCIDRQWQFESPKAGLDPGEIQSKRSEYWRMMLDTLSNGGTVQVSGLPHTQNGTIMRLADGYDEKITDNKNIRFSYIFTLEYIDN